MTIAVKAREISVKGPKGSLVRSFKHMAVDFTLDESAKSLKCEVWFGTRETIAAIRSAVLFLSVVNYLFIIFKFNCRTVCSHIKNMITGVTKGFKYKMRFCYAHFPINVTSVKEGGKDVVEIRNFLGEKKVRRVQLLDGVSYFRTPDVKDQIEISGIDITKVSLSCAQIRQSTAVKNKDIRKFLDGIYVSEKANIA